jgi:hypothetical protein
MSATGVARSMRIIMRATLHDHALNTYYGQWPKGKAAVPGLGSPAIAHHELVVSAGFVTFDGPERDFPKNRRRCVGNSYVDQKEICAHGEGTRLQRRPRRSPPLPKATALELR